LRAALVLDQARVIQRQCAAQLGLDDGLQSGVIHSAIAAHGRLQFFWVDLRVLAAGQVDRARGEVDREGDHPRDDIEQQADGVEDHDGRVHSAAALDLAATVGVENAAAGGQLGQQGGDQDAANQTRRYAHGDLLRGSRNYTRQMPNH
jgi:hypothetical protein